MRQDAADLVVENPYKLGPAWRLDTEQPFNSQAKRVLLGKRRDVVEPVEIRNRLEIGLCLDQLFGAAVKQPDVRIDPGYHLPVEVQDQTQYAVPGRRRPPEIDGEIAAGSFGHDHTFGRVFSSPGSG